MLNNRPHIVYGLLFAPIGVLAGIILTNIAIGSGYWQFIIAAPIAAFATGALFWYLIMVRRKSTCYKSAVLVGVLTGTLSHWVCWYLMIVIHYIFTKETEIHTPLSPWVGFFASFMYSVVSLIFFGVITISTAVIFALILNKVLIKKGLSNNLG